MTILALCLLLLAPAVAQDASEPVEAGSEAGDEADEIAWAAYTFAADGAWPQPPGDLQSLVVAWAPGPELRDIDGALTETLAAVWLGPQLGTAEATWTAGSGARHYRPDGSLLGLAAVELENETRGGNDVSGVPRSGNRDVDDAAGGAEDDASDAADETRPVEEAEARFRHMYDFLAPDEHDCLLRPVEKGRLMCSVPGLQGLGAIGPLQQETTDDGLLHAWGGDPTTRVDIWYEGGVPVARQVEVRHMTAEGLARAVLDLDDWDGAPAATGVVTGEPLAAPLIHHGAYGLPADGSLDHPFPLSEAVRLLLDERSVRRADGSGPDFTTWRTAARHPYIHYASFLEDVSDPQAPDAQWMLGWTDGHGSIYVQAVRDGAAPGPLSPLLGGDDNTTFTVVDGPAGMVAPLVPASMVPRYLPDVADMMRWWRAYADGWEGVEPNAYGFQVLCDDCRKPEMRLWAGHHASEQTTGGDETNSSQERVTRLSALYMDKDGRALGYEERDTVESSAQWFQPPLGLVPEDPLPGGIMPDDIRDLLGDPVAAGSMDGAGPQQSRPDADASAVDARGVPAPAAAWSLGALMALAAVRLHRARRR